MSSDAKNIGRKIFVGGLSLDTTDDSMKEYFESYGTVEHCNVMTHPGPERRSRGFGFVLFSATEEADNAFAEKEHVIDGKKIEVKMAVPKGQESAPPAPPPISSARVRKLFLGGLSPDTAEKVIEDTLNELIIQYSKHQGTTKVTINRDKNSDRPRGFGFAQIVCEPDDDKIACDIVDDILRGQSYVKIDGRDVELKKAVPREDMRQSQPSHQFRNDPRYSGYDAYSYGREMEKYMMSRMYQDGMNRYSAGYGYNPYDMYSRMKGFSAFSGGGGMGSAPTMDRGYSYDAAANMADYSRLWSSYAQSGSNYGPSRGNYGDYKDSRDRGDSKSSSSYHPYRKQ